MANTRKRKDVLCIRCSDSRSRLPRKLRFLQWFNWLPWLPFVSVHEIRKPGGVTNTYYRARNTKQELPLEKFKALLIENIDVMVKIKDVNEIVIISHNLCGAADALGFTCEDTLQSNIDFVQKIKELYPTVKITVLHETHSASGLWHYGHRLVLTL